MNYDYPIDENNLDDNYINSKEKSYVHEDCKYSSSCYEANCSDCVMYKDI